MLKLRPSRLWAVSLVLLPALACLVAPPQVHAQPVVDSGRPPLVVNLQASNERIEMVVNTSRILTLDKNIPKAQVNNPDVLGITPLSPNQVQILAKKAGVTQVNLWDEADQIHTVDVVVFGDAQELQMVLQSQFPKSSLRVIPLANSVVVSGYVDRPDIVNRIIQIAEDYHPKVINNIAVGGVQQVLLHVKVMEVSRTRLRTLGFDFAEINGDDFVVSGISGLLSSFASDTGLVETTGGETLTFGVVNGSNSFFGFLEALRQNNLLKILAEPDLVAVSGRPASFNVGGEFPILVPQSLGTVSIEYKKFGTQVDFVPIVLGNGRIRLEVRPRVSEIDNTRSVIINEITVPGLRVREVETGVEMRAGQTLAVAGLVQTRQEASMRGLPFVSELPYLGALFRRTRSEENEIELLIMVTPELVDAMEPHEVPPGGPGTSTCLPTDCDLFWKGQLEVPCCGDPCGDCNYGAGYGMPCPVDGGFGYEGVPAGETVPPGMAVPQGGAMPQGGAVPQTPTGPQVVEPAPTAAPPMGMRAPQAPGAPARRYVNNMPVNGAPSANAAANPPLRTPALTSPDHASVTAPGVPPLPPRPGAGVAPRPPVVAERPRYAPLPPTNNRYVPGNPRPAPQAPAPPAPMPPGLIGPIGYDFE